MCYLKGPSRGPIIATRSSVGRLALTLQIRKHYVFTILNTSCEMSSLRSWKKPEYDALDGTKRLSTLNSCPVSSQVIIPLLIVPRTTNGLLFSIYPTNPVKGS